MGIGELQERSLHAQLKEWYATPRDRVEVPVEGYIIDLVRRRTLIEIQTRNFWAMKPKLERLLPDHRLRLVHPIAEEKWIVTTDAAGEVLRRTRSPKRGGYLELFRELVRLPTVVDHPNLALEALLVEVEELRCADGNGSWRRRGVSVRDTRLLEVRATRRFRRGADLAALLPRALGERFTNASLAAACHIHPSLASKTTYTLRRLGTLRVAGTQGRAHLYQRVESR